MYWAPLGRCDQRFQMQVETPVWSSRGSGWAQYWQWHSHLASSLPIPWKDQLWCICMDCYLEWSYPFKAWTTPSITSTNVCSWNSHQWCSRHPLGLCEVFTLNFSHSWSQEGRRRQEWVVNLGSTPKSVTVINRNGRCKPKFILWFLVHSFYDQFSDRHCRSIRWLLPWIMAFCCHFVMPLITTVQVPAILYVLRLPRDSVIGSFRRWHPSISLWCWRLICSLFQRGSKLKDSRVRGWS